MVLRRIAKPYGMLCKLQVSFRKQPLIIGLFCRKRSPMGCFVSCNFKTRHSRNGLWIHATLCNTQIHHTATHCNTLQHTTLQHTAVHHTSTRCNMLQHTATHCIIPHCNTLQSTTLQHTATHFNAPHCNAQTISRLFSAETGCKWISLLNSVHILMYKL